MINLSRVHSAIDRTKEIQNAKKHRKEQIQCEQEYANQKLKDKANAMKVEKDVALQQSQ